MNCLWTYFACRAPRLGSTVSPCCRCPSRSRWGFARPARSLGASTSPRQTRTWSRRRIERVGKSFCGVGMRNFYLSKDSGEATLLEHKCVATVYSDLSGFAQVCQIPFLNLLKNCASACGARQTAIRQKASTCNNFILINHVCFVREFGRDWFLRCAQP